MSEIEMEGICFSYERGLAAHKKVILNSISLMIEKGESIGLIGGNGVGKSTLLKLLVGIQLDYTGILNIQGIGVKKENLEHVREKMGYIFQDSDNQLFMTKVYEDVAFAPYNYGLPSKEVKARVEEALQKVGIENLMNQRTYQLSGGQKKMVSIATILSMRPDIVLMDEPSAALDPRNRRNLIKILNELKVTKIIASHDLDLVYDTCERTILLNDGLVIADGDTKKILTNKTLLEQNLLELPLSLSRK